MTDIQNLLILGVAGRLAVRTKSLSAQSKRVVILVQGAEMTGQMGYDFSFPGSKDYSMMDAFAASGFGVVTFSVRGYGLSELNSDPFDVRTDQAIEDLATVVDWVCAQGHTRPNLLGWSWGGRIAGRFAEAHSALINRLVLLDPALGGGPNNLPPPVDPWWTNTHEYFLSGLEKDLMDSEALDALGRRMEAEEPRSPNGPHLENAIGSIGVDPLKVMCPTMMLYGSEAGKQDCPPGDWDRLVFFKSLASDDKTFVIVPGGGDYAHLQSPRARVFAASIDFLSQD